MCGRARLSSDVSEIKLVFSIPPERPTPNIPANWNAAPTEDLPVVRYDARAGGRSLDVMRWGLVPFWAKDIKVGFSNINAKAETIDTRPAFREAFARRRCLVPFDCFYEWKKLGKEREPYAVALADRRLMALAGLWESWRSPAGERVRSFTIVTTAPNALLAELHDRMPVILAPEDWPLWLGERPADPEQLKALLKPYPGRGHGHLAGRQAGGRSEEQGPVADRTRYGRPDEICRSDRRREAPWTTVFADRHIGENRFSHLAGLIGGQVPAPCLNANGHRAPPGPDKLAIETDLVSDKDGLVKHHAVDGHRGAPPPAALRRETASGEIHLCEQPSAKDVTVRIGVGRHGDDAYERQRPRKFRLRPRRRGGSRCGDPWHLRASVRQQPWGG